MRLSPAEQKVLDALVSPRTRMQLIEDTGMARETVQRALEGLELKGLELKGLVRPCGFGESPRGGKPVLWARTGAPTTVADRLARLESQVADLTARLGAR